MGLIQKGIGGGMTKPKQAANATNSLVRAAQTRALGQASGLGLAAIQAMERITGVRLDPAPAYLFFVELGGIVVGAFTECSGLAMRREVEEYVEGGVNNFVHKFPGRSQYDNIVLSRGLSVSRALWNWYQEGMYDGKVRRINFSIIVGAPGQNAAVQIGWRASQGWRAGREKGNVGAQQVFSSAAEWIGGFGKVKHWNIENAFPVRWEGPELDTSSDDTAVETIEIAHEGLELSYEVLTPLSPAVGIARKGVSSIPT